VLGDTLAQSGATPCYQNALACERCLIEEHGFTSVKVSLQVQQGRGLAALGREQRGL